MYKTTKYDKKFVTNYLIYFIQINTKIIKITKSSSGWHILHNTSKYLTETILIYRWLYMGNHPPPSENRVFSATEHRMNPRLVCKLEFCHCGPVEKKLERSICLGLVMTAWQSWVGSKNPNLKILNFFASTSKLYNKSRTSFQISSPNT